MRRTFSVFSWVGVQRGAAIVAGSALIVSAMLTLSDRDARVRWHPGWIAQLMNATRAPGHPLVLGMFLGFLPCGLVHTAALAAVAKGDAIGGATALAASGLGTVPALLGLSLAERVLGGRPLLTRLSTVFVLLMGVWFLWNGLAV